MDDRHSSSAPSYWQLLTAQYGKDDGQYGCSPHGPFLVSAQQARRLAEKLCHSVYLRIAQAKCATLGLEKVDPVGIIPKGSREKLLTQSADSLGPSPGVKQLTLALSLFLSCERHPDKVSSCDVQAVRQLARAAYEVGLP